MLAKSICDRSRRVCGLQLEHDVLHKMCQTFLALRIFGRPNEVAHVDLNQVGIFVGNRRDRHAVADAEERDVVTVSKGSSFADSFCGWCKRAGTGAAAEKHGEEGGECRCETNVNT